MSPFDALAIYAVIAYIWIRSLCTSERWDARSSGRDGGSGGETWRVFPIQHRSRFGGVQGGDRASAVITKDGERIEADVVVLNPDLPIAYRDLLGMKPWSIRRLTYSPHASCWPDRYSPLQPDRFHHNIHFGRSWKGVFKELMMINQIMSGPKLLRHQLDSTTRSWPRTGTRTTTSCS